MSPDLDLDLHPEREAGDADTAQDGLVARHICPHVVDKVRDGLVGDVGGVVQLHGVDVLPAGAGERERVPDVVEGPVDLLDEVWLDLAGLAVPTAYGSSFREKWTYEVEGGGGDVVPCPATSITSPTRTAWL